MTHAIQSTMSLALTAALATAAPAVAPVAPVSANVVALNTATKAARDVQSPMVLPVAVVPAVVKAGRVPAHAYHESIGKAARSFVRAMVKTGIALEKLALTASAHAMQFVAAAHTAKPDYAGYIAAQNEIKAAADSVMCMAPMTLIKAYRVALVQTFGGDLPVSESAAAQAKAKARAKAKQNKAAKGAAKGVPEVKPAAEHEVIGQFIAKYGTAAVLVELAKILSTEKATVADAHILVDVAKHYAK